MAKEEKSVRSQVEAIEQRTAKLEPVLEKLSDSLDKIAESFTNQSKEKEDSGDERQDLIKQFKQPFATPQAVKEDGKDLDLLDDIRDEISFAARDQFKFLKNIDETLQRIEQMGGTMGGKGGLPDIDIDLDKKRKKKPKVDVDGPDKKSTTKAVDAAGKKATGKATEAAGKKATEKATEAAGKKAAGGALSRIGGGLARAARFAGPVGLAVGGVMAAADAYQGFTNPEETLGIEGRKATFGEKLSAAGGGIVEGLTFGLVGKKSAGNFLAGLFGAGPDAKEKEEIAQKAIEQGASPEQAAQIAQEKVEGTQAQPTVADDFDAMATSMTSVTPVSENAAVVNKTQPISTAGAIAAANVRGASPDFKYIEEQRKKREGVKPATTVTGETPKVGALAKPTFEDLAMEEAKKFGRDKPNVDDRKAAALKFKAQQLEGKSEGVVKGPMTTDSSPVSPPAALVSSSVSPPSASVEPSKTVNQMSQENADMKTEATSVQPVVINNQSTVSSNQQSFTPLRTVPRPNNNSFERKVAAVSAYT